MEFRVVFLLAVIACSHLAFSSVDGRQIKSVSKNDNYSKQSSQADNSAMHKEDHQPADVPSYHSVSGRKEILPPSMPIKSSDFGVSVEGYEDGFRPTTPGNSPGAGHSFEEDDKDTEQKPGESISSINDKHSIAGANKEDQRTTSPGHSPGVGHVFPTKNSEPNA